MDDRIDQVKRRLEEQRMRTGVVDVDEYVPRGHFDPPETGRVVAENPSKFVADEAPADEEAPAAAGGARRRISLESSLALSSAGIQEPKSLIKVPGHGLIKVPPPTQQQQQQQQQHGGGQQGQQRSTTTPYAAAAPTRPATTQQLLEQKEPGLMIPSSSQHSSSKASRVSSTSAEVGTGSHPTTGSGSPPRHQNHGMSTGISSRYFGGPTAAGLRASGNSSGAPHNRESIQNRGPGAFLVAAAAAAPNATAATADSSAFDEEDNESSILEIPDVPHGQIWGQSLIDLKSEGMHNIEDMPMVVTQAMPPPHPRNHGVQGMPPPPHHEASQPDTTTPTVARDNSRNNINSNGQQQQGMMNEDNSKRLIEAVLVGDAPSSKVIPGEEQEDDGKEDKQDEGSASNDAAVVSTDTKQVASAVDVVNERSNKRCMCAAMAIGWALVIIIVVVVVTLVMTGVMSSGGDSKDDAKAEPQLTPEERYVFLEEYLQPLRGDSATYGNLSPQTWALDWMAFHDVLTTQLIANDKLETLQQRYILAVFYYTMTQGQNQWSHCKPMETGEEDACIHPVLESYQVEGIHYDQHMSEPAFRWLASVDECRWAGVKCADNANVTHLQLAGYDLEGTLPVELGYLSTLKVLDLQLNWLQGTLPEEWGAISSKDHAWQSIRLGRNELTGSIPEEWCLLSSLTTLSLNDNELTGNLPSCLSNLQALINLSVMHNELSDSIPLSLAKLSNLQRLHIAGNQFSGEVPRIFCSGDRLFQGSADCASELSANYVKCFCCTVCCNGDRDEEECNEKFTVADEGKGGL